MKAKAQLPRYPRARRAPPDLRLDRAVFAVSPNADVGFLARLAKPPKPNERLRRTMQTTPPWE